MVIFYQYPVTTDSAGGFTGTTIPFPSSRVQSIRVNNAGSTLTAGGTGDFTFTRTADGGTVLAVSNQAAPWQFQPREALHSTSGGTTAYALGIGPVVDTLGVPVDGSITVDIAQAAVSASGTIFFYLEGR